MDFRPLEGRPANQQLHPGEVLRQDRGVEPSKAEPGEEERRIMTRSTFGALAAALTVLSALPAATTAAEFQIRNCTLETASFNAYGSNDTMQWIAASSSGWLGQGAQAQLRCATPSCKIKMEASVELTTEQSLYSQETCFYRTSILNTSGVGTYGIQYYYGLSDDASVCRQRC
jgi:hypothetical protein